MNPPITLDLHRRYLELILKQADEVTVEDDVVRALTMALDSNEEYYHVEGKVVYRSKYWKSHTERRELLKAQLEKFKVDVDKRKAAWDILTTKVKDQFGFDDEAIARKIAHGMLVKNKIGAALLMGVDLTQVPQITGKYIVIDGQYFYEL
jgi:hypothetical protein